MKANLRLAALLLAVVGAGPALACYTVYDRSDNVVYNAMVPPVDMSLPLHEALQAAYPGGHLVFGSDQGCPATNTASPARHASPNGKTPLLTDAATAQELGLPHTMLRNVAVVPETPDTMHPGVMIVESTPRNADDTRAMGAAPAPQRAKATTVITEMHNPPLTAVQKQGR